MKEIGRLIIWKRGDELPTGVLELAKSLLLRNVNCPLEIRWPGGMAIRVSFLKYFQPKICLI